MKKLLSLLGAITIVGTSMPTVIAASNYEKQGTNDGIDKYDINKLPKVDLYLSRSTFVELKNYFKNNDVNSIVNLLATKFNLPQGILSLFIPKVVEQLKNKDLLSYDKNNGGVIIQLDNVLTNPSITNILNQ